jgi:hypothetical protein
VVVLNSIQAITDLLDGRSAIYSDRIQPYFHCELVNRKYSVFNISSQHPRFRVYRRMMQTGLNPRAVKRYEAVIAQERATLLLALLSNPERFVTHLRRSISALYNDRYPELTFYRTAGAVVLSVVYGWTVTSDDDYFVTIFHRAAQIFAQSTKSGRWLVDFLPIRPWLLIL